MIYAIALPAVDGTTDSVATSVLKLTPFMTVPLNAIER
jgi:hypothetical protein